MRFKFTDYEIKKILKKMVILTDSREQRNEHILKYFDDNKIPYIKVKNDFGDYSCMFPKGCIQGIDRDIYMDRLVSIERKKDIDELAGNLRSENKPRIKAEFAHINKYDIKCHLLLEDHLYYKHLRDGKYKSLWKPASLNGSINGLMSDYNISFEPINKEDSAPRIYNILYYFCNSYFKNNFDINVDIKK